MHLERQNAFQNAQNFIFFPEITYVCLPYLKNSDLLPETHFLFGPTKTIKTLWLFQLSVE